MSQIVPVLLDQEQFSCSICLDLLNDPVALPCGHSYCSGCIGGCWDKAERNGVTSCPQCRQSFTPRPALRRNTMLAELVEKLKETAGEDQATTSELTSPAGSELVTCDLCPGTRKQRAYRSCLVCLMSYCQIHLQPHYQFPGLQKHKLVKATSGLPERICSSHGRPLEVYCRTDQQCICLMCVMEEHKGHDTQSATAERAEKQKQSQQEVQPRVQDRERELRGFQQVVQTLEHIGQAAENDCERIFTELIRSVKRRRSEVKELIRAQQRAAVSQLDGPVERLEREIAELRRRDVELEQLSQTDDHIHFLQRYQSLSNPSASSDHPSLSLRPVEYLRDVTRFVSELREEVENVIEGQWPRISTTTGVLLSPEPKTRADLLHYSCQLSLDPNTAHQNLSLGEENRKVTRYLNQIQPYPAHPDRFTSWRQVLCREALSGRCYWEVEWRGSSVYIAVAYKNLSRTSADSGFGHNDKSWSLECASHGYYFRHNNVMTKVPGPQSSRVGVYLDHEAGSLSFYSVSDTATLLHRVQTTFTQSLYAGFCTWTVNDSVEIRKHW